MSTNQNNLFYMALISLTVIFTLAFIYSSGLSNSGAWDESRNAIVRDTFSLNTKSLFSLIPMAITVKIYRDIMSLLSTQDQIVAQVSKLSKNRQGES